MSTQDDSDDAVTDWWIPKRETRADIFVSATGYAGQGITIGILDTGIDPATHGHVSAVPRSVNDASTGAPVNDHRDHRKLVDVVDCTGSGDVDVSTEKRLTPPSSSSSSANSENNENILTPTTTTSTAPWTVQGLSGRTLQIPVHLWNIQPFPTTTTTSTATTATSSDARSVRLGWKRAYEFIPQPLIQRLKAHRQQRYQLTERARHVARLRAQLALWHTTHVVAAAAAAGTAASKPNPKPTVEQVAQRDDWLALLEILGCSSSNNSNNNDSGMEEIHNDPGPLYDCVVYWDGSTYRAAIDVNETGDLTTVTPLAAFGLEYGYGTFGTVDTLNFAVQFYNEGTLLSIVTDCSPHGTHVASIAADASRGVAPLARLVSFKIGEPRLGTMETGAALARALQLAASKYKCDIVNLSYGEATQLPNQGRFIQQAEELVWQHNVIFVAAAGNQGPALSSVNAPGGTTSACIGVGAYISPHMRPTLYSCLPPSTPPPPSSSSTAVASVIDTDTDANQATATTETTFTWSSTGPTADGDWGVNVMAPGGAIATVPHWCLSNSRLMNGTSMASPHVTGCIALLLSACRAEGIAVSSARIRRALENTARVVPNLSPLQQGFGMLQVDAAWDYLKANRDEPTEDVHFQVKVVNASGQPRGIYLRQLDESSMRQTFAIQVDPQFRREDTPSETMQRRKIDFAMNFALECSTEAASWVQFPTNFILLANEGRTFEIEVDPTNLSPGVHVVHVYGLEVNKPQRKILFSVPITVIKPLLPVQPLVDLGALQFEDAEVKRFFVVPPAGSSWMDVTLQDTRQSAVDGDASNRVVALHTVQLLPHAAFRERECSKRLSLAPGQSSISSIAIEPGVTCEVALARYWSTRGPTKITASVMFRGVRPTPSEVIMSAGAGGTIVRLHSDLGNEIVQPCAKLTKWQMPVRPKADTVIAPVADDRDRFCGNEKQIYQLVLTYEFEQEENGSLTPQSPALQGVLYESGFESQCMFVFDGQKKYLGIADAYPSSVTVPKGQVIVRLQIRHDDPTKLEKLKDLVIWIERNLSKEISLPAFATKEALMLERDTFTKRVIRKGSSAVVFFAEPGHSKLPSGCTVGHKLTGTVTYEAGDASLSGSGKRPSGFPISYLVPPKPGKDATVDALTSEPTAKPSSDQILENAIRDLKVEHLGKLSNENNTEQEFETLFAKLVSEFPDHLPLWVAKLKFLDSHSKRAEKLVDVIAAANEVVSRIDEDELALNLGRKVNSEDGDAVKLREEIKEKKNILIESLVRLALAYDEAEEDADFVHTLKRLKAWIDVEASTGGKYSTLFIAKHVHAGHYGLALKQINKMLVKETKDKDTTIRPLTRSELLAKRSSLLALLDFSLLADYDAKRRVLACPEKYTLF